jgi:predicted nucleotidyltransferase
MKKQEVLEKLRFHLPELRERFLVRDLMLFGSVARDEAMDSSDVDLVVEFEGTATFDRFMGLKFFLENLLGCEVDLVTRKALRPAIRASIEREAIHVA